MQNNELIPNENRNSDVVELYIKENTSQAVIRSLMIIVIP